MSCHFFAATWQGHPLSVLFDRFGRGALGGCQRRGVSSPCGRSRSALCRLPLTDDENETSAIGLPS